MKPDYEFRARVSFFGTETNKVYYQLQRRHLGWRRFLGWRDCDGNNLAEDQVPIVLKALKNPYMT